MAIEPGGGAMSFFGGRDVLDKGREEKMKFVGESTCFTRGVKYCWMTYPHNKRTKFNTNLKAPPNRVTYDPVT
jgi:hypothetical protein